MPKLEQMPVFQVHIVCECGYAKVFGVIESEENGFFIGHLCKECGRFDRLTRFHENTTRDEFDRTRKILSQLDDEVLELAIEKMGLKR